MWPFPNPARNPISNAFPEETRYHQGALKQYHQSGGTKGVAQAETSPARRYDRRSCRPDELNGSSACPAENQRRWPAPDDSTKDPKHLPQAEAAASFSSSSESDRWHTRPRKPPHRTSEESGRVLISCTHERLGLKNVRRMPPDFVSSPPLQRPPYPPAESAARE